MCKYLVQCPGATGLSVGWPSGVSRCYLLQVAWLVCAARHLLLVPCCCLAPACACCDSGRHLHTWLSGRQFSDGCHHSHDLGLGAWAALQSHSAISLHPVCVQTLSHCQSVAPAHLGSMRGCICIKKVCCALQANTSCLPGCRLLGNVHQYVCLLAPPAAC